MPKEEGPRTRTCSRSRRRRSIADPGKQRQRRRPIHSEACPLRYMSSASSTSSSSRSSDPTRSSSYRHRHSGSYLPAPIQHHTLNCFPRLASDRHTSAGGRTCPITDEVRLLRRHPPHDLAFRVPLDCIPAPSRHRTRKAPTQHHPPFLTSLRKTVSHTSLCLNLGTATGIPTHLCLPHTPAAEPAAQ